ncbi:MAG: endonuclease/exonuclease/phosphatase family protein [Halomonas sp.]|nr:endonuclease/exonuclease/phosphatase family protein [Halomonas sp.]MDN6298540.1 endonuclease/exonuclease/phosphatase family protein [Halomonas sp.]MDN6315742.1 endonuclease/exonuclease/phosphatase family protein [Halomonas sp.]MDN6337145.1 endonuclease/exonuclease/phosphatase family protein [Halomonas sp.]
MLTLVLAVATAVLLAASTLGRIPVHQWWARICEFPRLQIASLAALCLVISLFAAPDWRLGLVLVNALVIAVQLRRILPYTRLMPIKVQRTEKDGDPQRCVTLLVANVLTPNRDAPKLIKQIKAHQPDVVLTLESDNWWQNQLDPVLDEEWPHSVKVPLDNLYGMHLYSRLPLEEAEIKWLIQDDIPSIHAWLRLPSGERVRFYALHPRPPAPSESETSLWRDGELLLVGKMIDQNPQPTLAAGDLNDVAWSRSTRMFCRVSHMMDPRRGRGMFSTFHAKYPFLRWPLDHIFVSEHFTLTHMQRLEEIGSDHYPFLATLCLQPSRKDEHDAPEADGEDHEDAAETIDEARYQRQDS